VTEKVVDDGRSCVSRTNHDNITFPGQTLAGSMIIQRMGLCSPKGCRPMRNRLRVRVHPLCCCFLCLESLRWDRRRVLEKELIYAVAATSVLGGPRLLR
jgi:hypothetical protein